MSGVLPAAAETELLLKLKQVQDNAWLVFNELPPGAARTRALHVFLDAQELKKRLEPLLHEADHRTT